MLVAAAVEEPPLAVPPGSPAIGNCYIVGASPSGDWAGHAQQLAAFTSGGWRFIAPREGMTALVRSSGSIAAYRAGAWEIGTLRGSEVAIDGQKWWVRAARQSRQRPAAARPMPKRERQSA